MLKILSGTRSLTAVLSLIFSLCSGSYALAASLTLIESFDPQLVGVEAIAVSDDGTLIACNKLLENGSTAVLWDAERGMVALGPLPTGVVSSEAIGLSAAGDVLLGNFYFEDGVKPFLWRHTTGYKLIGDMLEGDYDTATAISRNGRVVVGYSSSEADGKASGFRWEDGLVVDIGDDSADSCKPLGLSVDGNYVVGRCDLAEAVDVDDGYLLRNYEAFRWSQSEGNRRLGNSVNDGVSTVLSSEATAVLENGEVLGHSTPDSYALPTAPRSFRWSEETNGVEYLAPLPNQFFVPMVTFTYDATPDGSVSVGNLGFPLSERAIVRDASGTPYLLETILTDKGLDLGGVQELNQLQGVSSNGRFCVGNATLVDGSGVGFVVDLEDTPLNAEIGEMEIVRFESSVEIWFATPSFGGLHVLQKWSAEGGWEDVITAGGYYPANGNLFRTYVVDQNGELDPFSAAIFRVRKVRD